VLRRSRFTCQRPLRALAGLPLAQGLTSSALSFGHCGRHDDSASGERFLDRTGAARGEPYGLAGGKRLLNRNCCSSASSSSALAMRIRCWIGSGSGRLLSILDGSICGAGSLSRCSAPSET
jgi:hypothetical protein